MSIVVDKRNTISVYRTNYNCGMYEMSVGVWDNKCSPKHRRNVCYNFMQKLHERSDGLIVTYILSFHSIGPTSERAPMYNTLISCAKACKGTRVSKMFSERGRYAEKTNILYYRITINRKEFSLPKCAKIIE